MKNKKQNSLITKGKLFVCTVLLLATTFMFGGISCLLPKAAQTKFSASEHEYTFTSLVSPLTTGFTVNKIIEKNNKLYLIGGNFAVYDIETVTLKYINCPHGTGLTNAVYTAVEYNNKIYFGGMGGIAGKMGIFDIATETITLVTSPFGTSNHTIQSMAIKDNNIYVGGQEGKIAIFNLETQTFGSLLSHNFPTGTSGVRYFQTMKAVGDYIFISGWNSTFGYYHIPTKSFSNMITCPVNLINAMVDIDDKLYVGGNSGEFAVFDLKTLTFGSKLATTFGTNAIKAMYEYENKLYIGGANGAFVIYDLETQLFGNLMSSQINTAIGSFCEKDYKLYIGANAQFASLNLPKVILPSYEITFKTYNGEVIETQNIETDTFIENLPEAPIRAGHRFAGWLSDNGTNITDAVTRNAVFTAQYIKTFSVVFKDYDGSIIDELVIDINKTVESLPTNPIRTGYYFIGWASSNNLLPTSQITQDTVFTAQYGFKVEFYYKATLIGTKYVVENGFAPLPAQPEADYRYNWGKAGSTKITQDTVFDATLEYKVQLKYFKLERYTIEEKGKTFNYDMITYKTTSQWIAENEKVNINAFDSATYNILGTAYYETCPGFTFLGWDYDLTQSITKPLTITANYKLPTLKVNYYSSNGVLFEQREYDLMQAGLLLPMPEFKTGDWWGEFRNIIQNIFRLDFAGLIDDLLAADAAAKMANHLVNKYDDETNQIFVIIAKVDFRSEVKKGIMGDLSADFDSNGTFMRLRGNRNANNLVLYMNPMSIYSSNINYEISIHFGIFIDPVIDGISNVISNIGNGIGNFFSKIENIIIVSIIASVLIAVIGVVASASKKKS